MLTASNLTVWAGLPWIRWRMAKVSLLRHNNTREDCLIWECGFRFSFLLILSVEFEVASLSLLLLGNPSVGRAKNYATTKICSMHRIEKSWC
jgi:hypothetical protein